MEAATVISLVALVLALISLGWQVRTETMKRHIDAERWRESGPVIEIMARATKRDKEIFYDINIVNVGRMAATITDIGAMAVSPEGVFKTMSVQIPDLLPKRLEAKDNVALSLPLDRLVALRQDFPESIVRTYVAIAGQEPAFGPEVPI